MKKINHGKFKKNITKTHQDKGLQYYKDTLRKKDIASPVISLPEFITRYSKFKPNVNKLIYGGSFIPNEPHNCNGNSLYVISLPRNSFHPLIVCMLCINNYHYSYVVLLE